jgi:hypothetical protein
MSGSARADVVCAAAGRCPRSGRATTALLAIALVPSSLAGCSAGARVDGASGVPDAHAASSARAAASAGDGPTHASSPSDGPTHASSPSDGSGAEASPSAASSAAKDGRPDASARTADAKAAKGGVPRVVVKEPTVGPSYAPENITRAIAQVRRRIGRCAELHAEDPPSEPATLRFTIAPDGAVKGAAFVRDDRPVAPDARQACLLGVVESLSFPAPSGGSIVVTYPLNVDPI